MANPQALGELLRSRRERLTPAEAGLPPGRRRRTPGLRREEVALLANLSPTYYTFLEQGRPVRPSQQVLDSLAVALRLSEVEARYLAQLANGPATSSPTVPVEELTSAVADLVQRLDPAPAYVKGRHWDVLAANPAARELFTDWESRPPDQRNHVVWMFASDEAQRVYVEWETEAKAMLGRFRMAASRWPGDPAFAAVVDQLHRDSDLVRRWWPQHEVISSGSGLKRLRHPVLGVGNYSHAVLQNADDPSQTLVTFTRC